MRLNAFELHRYLNACAEKGGCSIVWEDNMQPRTDGKQVFLPHVSMFTTDEEAADLIFFVNHETSHIRFSAFDDVPEYEWMSPMYSLLGLVWGILEDNRVDYLNDIQYLGDKEANITAREKYRGPFYENISCNYSQEDQDRMFSVLLFSEAVRASTYWNSTEKFNEIWEEHASDKAKEYFRKMLDLDIKQDFEKVKVLEHKHAGTRGTAAVAMDIWERVFEDSVDKEKERMKKVREMLEKANASNEKGNPNTQGGQAQPGKAGDGEGTPGESKDGKRISDPDERIDVVDYSKAAGHLVHNLEPNGEVHNVGLQIKLPPPKDGAAEYQQPPREAYSTLDFWNPRASTLEVSQQWMQPDSPQGREYKRSIMALYNKRQMDGFASRVRRLIQIRSKGQREYGVRQGKLQRNLVHRICVPDSPQSSRVFHRTKKSNVLDTCISLVIDCSGSMSGAKYKHAAAAAMVLNDTFANVLRIPVEIIGFTDGYHRRNNDSKMTAQNMYLMKQFMEPAVHTNELIARFGTCAQHMGANGDGEALVYVLDRLLQQKAKRKIMVVLSDGQPVTNYNGDIQSYTKQVIKRIQATPGVEIHGIGIMSSAVKDYYDSYDVIDNADGIEVALINVLQSKILKEN